MILLLKCDRCGKEGGSDTVHLDYHDLAYCEPCDRQNQIERLQRQIADKQNWLDGHLAELRELQAKLAELQQKVQP